MRWRSAEARPQGRRADRGRRALVDRRRLFRRPRGLPRRAEAARRCSRPSVTFGLWIAIALFIVVNDVVGDTWIAATLTVRTVEWYKVLVPLPYVAMLAIVHAAHHRPALVRSGAARRAAVARVDGAGRFHCTCASPTTPSPRRFRRFGGPYPLLIGACSRCPY